MERNPQRGKRPPSQAGGGGGRPLMVTTNCFQLRQSPLGSVCLYFVEFHPDVEDNDRRLRSQLIGSLRQRIQDRLGQFLIAGLNLISIREVLEPFSLQTEHQDTQYLLNIKLVGKMGSHHQDAYRMFLNVTMKRMLQALGLKQITRLPKYYDQNMTQVIHDLRMEIWRGFDVGFSHMHQDVMLNIDFTSKIIRQETVLEMLSELRREIQGGNIQQQINEMMKGMIVMANYGNNRCYRIETVLLNQSPNNTFNCKGQDITFIQYYRKTYKISNISPNQPLLLSINRRTGDQIKLIPSLCNPTGLTDQQRANFQTMNAVAQYTRLRPQDGLQLTRNMARKLSSDPAVRPIVQEFKLQINFNPVKVEAQTLALPTILVGQNQQIQPDARANFNLRGLLLESVPIQAWAVISSQRDKPNRGKLIKALSNKATQIGLQLGNPYQFNFGNRESLEKLLTQLSNPPRGNQPPQIAVIIIPPNLKGLYEMIKKISSTRTGIPTQCIRGPNMNNPKRFDSIMQKVIVQIACKTGSVPWVIPPTPGIPQKTMVVGIDVHHDNVIRSQSVVGFVASVHPQFTKYYNTIKFQQRQGEEIVTNISDCLREALEAFYEQTRRRFLPDLIVIYRDGVGDSQIPAVKEFQVEAMKRVFSNFEGYNPAFVHIVVNKSTNMRFYVENGGRVDNPPAGTLITDLVVPDDLSFYMTSQVVNQGRASPTLYRVIEKLTHGNNLPTINLAMLTLKLCFLYPNWTGGIKIPAPVMMADKLAMLVGQNVHENYSQRIKLNPWFLQVRI